MTKTEIESQTQDKIIEKYDALKSGDISREDWALYLCNLLENYIKKLIAVKHRTIGADYQDLIQQGYLAVCEQLDNYDPHLGMPTSYFTEFINQYTKDACDNSGMTKYYVGTATKLEKIAKKYGYDGITDPNLSPDTLAVLANTSLMTVLETIKFKSATLVSLEATSENFEMESTFKTPEHAALDKERDEFLRSQFDKLSPLEKYLLLETVLSDEPKSYRAILAALKTPELHARFEDELPNKVEQVYLEQKTNHALRRIRYSPGAKKLFQMEERPIELVEQASTDDIESAIMSNLLEL